MTTPPRHKENSLAMNNCTLSHTHHNTYNVLLWPASFVLIHSDAFSTAWKTHTTEEEMKNGFWRMRKKPPNRNSSLTLREEPAAPKLVPFCGLYTLLHEHRFIRSALHIRDSMSPHFNLALSHSLIHVRENALWTSHIYTLFRLISCRFADCLNTLCVCVCVFCLWSFLRIFKNKQFITVWQKASKANKICNDENEIFCLVSLFPPLSPRLSLYISSK